MPNYKVGSVISGCVTGIEKYGIFVSLDNYYSGLIHISEISDDFVKNVNDYVHVGETIKVRILEINSEECHMKLSIKDLDYRLNKKNKTKIKETTNGFSSLKENLQPWIEAKLEELTLKN